MSLRSYLDSLHPKFEKGGPYEKYYALYEVLDTFMYTPGEVTGRAPHVRDAIDLKRVMSVVVFALLPCFIMAMWNTGMIANNAMASSGIASAGGWRGALIDALGIGYDPSSFIANFLHGALYFFPIYIVCNIAGGFWEVLFSIVRKHEVNEGFLVTGSLIPLIVPATIPLWQVAVGTSFGVVIGKEVFGGTGKNFLNPALTARAFLFFAYPGQISGNAVWTAVDGYTGATALSLVQEGGMAALTAQMSWMDAFLGFIPGSIGETSALACLFGAIVLCITGIGSWRIMLSTLIGAVGLASILNGIGSDTNLMFQLPAAWHIVLGGFAFGLVFMATDPVSGAMTEKGQWVYGLLIGVMVILVRVVNPAFPEGMMLAILFGNVFAPVIDNLVVKGDIKRRRLRNV